MAVTIDDLPSQRIGDLGAMQRITTDLLAQIQAAGVPVVGFSNEGKIHVQDQEGERTALLQQWVDAGHAMGNHTYSHASLFDTPLASFQEDVLRGEPVLKRLLDARGADSLVYFRHPYLNTGPDLETKRAFETWLASRGYRVAPVTHDNSEWIYANAYRRADTPEARARVADAYIAYMDTTAAYFERLSRDLFGREIRGVLLIHANALNADHFGRLVDMFRARGYTFITLDEALEDPAYRSDDTYTGRAGMSWLQRWAITRGVRFAPEPLPDDWVQTLTQR